MMTYEELDDLKKIKKEYGEKMAQACRKWFPTILEYKGLLYHILSTHFEKSKSLYWDIINQFKEDEFRDYIYDFFDFEITNSSRTKKTVEELLREKGYELFECKTYEEIQKFRKYYSKLGFEYTDWLSNGIPRHVGEELCTFSDMGRLEDYYVFFIVRNDADEVKRSETPERDDSYSTSVLSIQFEKGHRQRASIKSRYNHSVTNPDAVYGNDLEQIADGLTNAFERDYGFKNVSYFSGNFTLENYIQANNGRFYKYNNKINSVCYCPNNIIIDHGEVVDRYKDKSRYTFMDYFILDEVEKKIIVYDVELRDSFVDGLWNITNIEITNREGYKEVLLTMEDGTHAIIKLDKDGKIIGYENKYLTTVRHDFLFHNKSLKELKLDELRECGIGFLSDGGDLEELYLPNLVTCGDSFMHMCKHLRFLYLPKTRKVGDEFAMNCDALESVSMPALEECGNRFLVAGGTLTKISFPKLVVCGGYFISGMNNAKSVFLPELELCGDYFLAGQYDLKEISLPKLLVAGGYFLCWNQAITKADFPKLVSCSKQFLSYTEVLEKANFPELTQCGDSFLQFAREPLELNVPKLESKYYSRVGPFQAHMINIECDEDIKDGEDSAKTNNNKK